MTKALRAMRMRVAESMNTAPIEAAKPSTITVVGRPACCIAVIISTPSVTDPPPV